MVLQKSIAVKNNENLITEKVIVPLPTRSTWNVIMQYNILGKYIGLFTYKDKKLQKSKK